jgi:hypothetical protein
MLLESCSEMDVAKVSFSTASIGSEIEARVDLHGHEIVLFRLLMDLGCTLLHGDGPPRSRRVTYTPDDFSLS